MIQFPDTFMLQFEKFISLSCNRQKFIQEYLAESGIEAPVIQLEDKKHIYVKFPQTQYNPMFKIKTVIAHYDRVPESPGANDNSAAVFCMLEWSKRLIKTKSFHNIRLIFTDGEELGEEGVSSQGAYPLAALFRKLGITNDDVFVFDCMGRGDIPILAQTELPPKVSKSFASRYSDLENRAQKLIMNISGGKWFSLPCNYSDNASFIANGIPAVAFTMLPSDEVSVVLKGEQPKTWQLLHTVNDNIQSLNFSALDLTSKILDSLANMKTVL